MYDMFKMLYTKIFTFKRRNSIKNESSSYNNNGENNGENNSQLLKYQQVNAFLKRNVLSLILKVSTVCAFLVSCLNAKEHSSIVNAWSHRFFSSSFNFGMFYR